MSDPHYQGLVRSAAEPPPFSCRWHSEADDDAVHVIVGGELDIATVAQVDAALCRAWGSPAVIVLDLRDLEFIDSCGARWIVEADRRIRRAGGRMTVVRSDREEVDWLFALLGIDSLLEFVDRAPATPAAAPLSALASGPGVGRRMPMSMSAP